MSGKSQKTTSNQTQNTASTSTPNVPDWLANPAQAMAGQVGALQAQGPGAFTPGISSLQNQAVAGAGGLTSSPYYTQAGDTISGVPNVSADQVNGQSVLDNLSSYYTPFKDQVLNPVLNDYDAQAGQTRAAQAAAGARNSAFGGSRYGVQEGQTEADLARGRAATEGTLLQNMYGQAAGMSEADTARRQAAMTGNQAVNLQAGEANQNVGLQKGQLLAGLASSEGADARSNVALQGDLGAAQTQAENAAKQYPLQFQAQNEALLQGLNPGLFTGQSTTGTGTSTGTSKTQENPGLLDYLGTAAQIGSMFVPGAGAGGSGGLGALFGSGPTSLSTKFGNAMNNDPSGMWRLGSAVGA